tara:strand:+ start:77 stop:205 length:129 start_codon:yes stop_codon:yes gene_type:complete
MDWREKERIDYEIKAKRKDKDEQQLIWGVTIIVVGLILALIA